jgi:hypothetical protein
MEDRNGTDDFIVQDIYDIGGSRWIWKMLLGDLSIEYCNDINPRCFSFNGYGLDSLPTQEYESFKKLYPEDFKGGILVLPAISMVEHSIEINLCRKIVTWANDLFKEIVADIGQDNIPEQYRPVVKMIFAFAVGRFFNGSIYFDDRVQFDDDSICLEMPGFNEDLLIQMAELAVLQIKLDTVLVKDHKSGKILVVKCEYGSRRQ